MTLKVIAITLLVFVFSFTPELPAQCFQRPSRKTVPGFTNFDYTSISHHILVRACVRGPAIEKEIILILDTGTTKTMLSLELVSQLKLNRLGPSDIVGGGGGVTQSSVYDLPGLEADGHEAKHLRAATGEFPRGVDGLLAMDFLKRFVVILDYPHHRWALTDHEFDGAGFRVTRTLPFVASDFDEIFVASLLPNGLKLYLELDTGADIGADAMVHMDSIAGLKLGEPIAMWGLEDAVGGDYGVPIYSIPWIEIGGLRTKPASVAVYPTPSARQLHELPTGLIGVQLLERYVVEINSQERFVRLFTPRSGTLAGSKKSK